MAWKFKSKFNNKKTKYKNTTYDSKAEAKYAQILDLLLKSGEIKSIERQNKYPLPSLDGKRKFACKADFVVTSKTNKEYIIDVKGMFTVASKYKWAYWQHYYNKKVWIVPTTGLGAFDTSFLI